MNYNLPFIPERTEKPRQYGINMVIDKGLSLNEAENLISSAGDLVDFVKLGFGTSAVYKNLQEKIKLYKDNGINTYLGGTLFEVFVIRNMFDDYRKVLDKYNLEFAEVSDGEILMPHDEKLGYIQKLKEQVTVLSEVGSKEAGVIIPHAKWIEMMIEELKAGSWKVIAEAREGGTIGIYHKDGSANKELINSIKEKVDMKDVIWEAPFRSQQDWFIKNMGANVNLGNIPTTEVIALETSRLGLRGDTFFQFLPDEFQSKKQI